MGTIDQDILTAEFSRSFVTGNPERQALSMVFTGMLRRSEGVTGGAFQAKNCPDLVRGMTAGSHWKSVKSGIWSPSSILSDGEDSGWFDEE